MEAARFLERELLRLSGDTALILSNASQLHLLHSDKVSAYMIIVEKKHEQESNR